MPFLDSLDIANKALQHLGETRITSVDEDSKNNSSMAFAYDKLRRPELRRNLWKFSIKRAAIRPIGASTRLLAPRPWDNAVNYGQGSVVTDNNGDIWYTDQPNNLAQEPGVTSAWEQYFGPMTADLYDSTSSYYAGELVYTIEGSGGFVVFVSIQNTNTDEPGTSTPWDTTVTYEEGATVSRGGSQWFSLISLNTGITPADAPDAWDVTVTYSSSQQVTGSDGYIYTSIAGGNLAHDPTASDTATYWTATGTPAAWSRLPAIYSSSTKWQPIYSALKNIDFLSPIGSTRSVYHLPANYLRNAPQNPKQGANSYLGGPSGPAYNDWEIEGDYLLTGDAGIILFRFGADVTRVSKMDDLFCEGLACRMAVDTANELTQQDRNLQSTTALYKKFMGEARTVNAIEVGSEEPSEDDYLTVRY